MDEPLIQLFQNLGWSGAAGILFWKVLAPLTRSFIAKRGGDQGEALRKVKLLEDNDLHGIREDIRSLQKGYGKLSERIAVVETRQQNHIK